MPWSQVTATRYAAGRIWTNELSFDLFDRDWACIQIPFDWEMKTAINRGSAGTTALQVAFVFPDSWAYDTTYDTAIKCRLYLYFDTLTASGTAATMTVTFDNGSLESASSATGIKTASREYTTIPTGLTVEDLTVELTASVPPGSESGTADKNFGSGPRSYLVVNY